MSAETTTPTTSKKKDRLPQVQPGGGRISPRRRTLFKGTKAEVNTIVGEVVVRGDAHFVDKGITPFGPTDAIDIRRKIAGKEPHEPFHKKVARSRGRIEDLKRHKRPGGHAERRGAPAEAPVVVQQVPVQSDLQTQLDAFAGDKVMQDKVLANWRKKRDAAAPAEASASDLPPAPPALT